MRAPILFRSLNMAALVIAFFAIACCARSVAPTAGASLESPAELRIYVMRHLHTAGGPNPDLTDVGHKTAALLVEWFKVDPPSVIYISSTKRAGQTAAPLAGALGIAPNVYDPADTAGLVELVRQESGTVLVVGHSNTVPQIIEMLGGERPEDIAHDDFGDIWQLSWRAPHVTVQRLVIE